MFSLPKTSKSKNPADQFYQENFRLMEHLRKLQEKAIENSNTNQTINSNNTNQTKKNSNSTNKEIDLNDKSIPKVAIFENSTTGIRNKSNFDDELFDEFLCAETKLNTFQTKYFSFDMKNQLGFPPETYNFYFEIDNGVRKEIVTFIESNYFGSYSEIPLYTDAKLFLMKNDFTFKVKFQAQTKVTIKIKIRYFNSVFLNVNYTNSMLYDCRNAVKELDDYEDIEKNSQGKIK